MLWEVLLFWEDLVDLIYAALCLSDGLAQCVFSMFAGIVGWGWFTTYPILLTVEPVITGSLQHWQHQVKSQIAKFIGPTWGPPGSCRPHVGPMNLAIRDVDQNSQPVSFPQRQVLGMSVAYSTTMTKLNADQTLNSQQTPHSLPSLASYGVSDAVLKKSLASSSWVTGWKLWRGWLFD